MVGSRSLKVRSWFASSDLKDVSLGVSRFAFAWRSLKRRSHATGSGQNLGRSLKRRELRLSEHNDESQVLVRLQLA